MGGGGLGRAGLSVARGGGGSARTFCPRFERSIRIVAICVRSSLFSAFAARMVSRFCLMVHWDVS